MKLYQNSLKYVFIIGAMAAVASISACSSSSSTPATTTTTVTGVAKAPGGTIAQFENKSFLLATVDFLIPLAYSEITGLQPVGGADVELIRVDDSGNQVGDVLASTVTSITGDYSLALPSGVSFAGNLIVRITGNASTSLSAQVVDQTVDITPLSQFVLDKFVEDGTALDTLPVNEVVALRGRVEEFDLTVAPGANIAAMIAQLEASTVGAFLDNEIDIINSTPANSTVVTAATGNWSILEFELGLGDNDAFPFGTIFLDIYNENLSIADDGDLDIADGGITIDIVSSVIDVFTNFNVDGSDGSTNIYHEIGTGDSGDSIEANIDSAGNVSIAFPFEEELETVDLIGGGNDTDGDGPDFGWRWPPGTAVFFDTGNGNAKIGVLNEAGIRYGTTDTDFDGINDAVNPNDKQGDEVFIGLQFVLKQASSMTLADFNGVYGVVDMEFEVDTSPAASSSSVVGEITLNNGAATTTTGTVSELTIDRIPNLTTPNVFDVTLISTLDTAVPSDVFSYTTTATGGITVDFGDEDTLVGQSNDDASLIAFVGNSTVKTGTPLEVTSSDDSILLMTRLGSTTPAVTDSTYKLLPMLAEVSSSGATEFFTFYADSTMTFSNNIAATIDSKDVGFSRSSDVAQVEPVIDTSGSDAYIATIGANGSINLTRTETDGSVINLDGFISEDKKLMILRAHKEDPSDAGNQQLIGIMLGIMQ